MSLEIFDLTGKTAMITGSTKGLGEVAAIALAKAGASIAVCGRNRKNLEKSQCPEILFSVVCSEEKRSKFRKYSFLNVFERSIDLAIFKKNLL